MGYIIHEATTLSKVRSLVRQFAGKNNYRSTTSALIPRKGPDYQSRALVENQLQLPLLETVLREAEEYRLNDLLQRGWHILALEYLGEINKTGELTNRKAHFVLGHADLPAARYTLEPRDMYYVHAYRRRPGE